MAIRKIPPDAFSFYFGLGPGRSYQRVAHEYKVSKRSVVNLALREGWKGRLEEIEQKARRQASERALETLEEMNERHLKGLLLLQAKALEALRKFPIETALQAARSLESSIREERRIRGTPADSEGASVEDTIRREYERWMTAGVGAEEREPTESLAS
jgi:hypothetical protein